MSTPDLREALHAQLQDAWNRRGIAYNDLAVAKHNVENAGRAYHKANCDYHELSRAIAVVLNEPTESLEEEISSAAIRDSQGRDDQGGDCGGDEGTTAEQPEPVVQPRHS